jgi:hypothetical protein
VNYSSLPAELRPPMPKPPKLPIPTDESTLDEIGDFNEEAGDIYRNAMAKCPSMTLSHIYSSIL